MILKFNLNKFSDREEWIIFDGFDNIHYHYHYKDDQIGTRQNVRDYLRVSNNIKEFNDESPNMPTLKVLEDFYELWLIKGENVVCQILAHSPIFIMNDEGKTIERI